MWDEMRAHNNDYFSEFLNRLPHFIGQFLVKSSHGLNMRFNIYNWYVSEFVVIDYAYW